MRFAVYGVIGLAGCGFTHGEGPGSGTTVIVDDTADDFAAGTRDDLAIDPLGLLAPEAYIYSGLHARGYTTKSVTATTRSGDLTDAVLGPMRGERYGELPVTNWVYDHPHGLGLSAANNESFTVVYDGEIYLDGPTTLQLDCDDAGFIEVDIGATTLHLGCMYNPPTEPTLALAPPGPGWYAVRGAMSDAAGQAEFILSTVDASSAVHPIAPEAMRARVTAAHGTVVTAADDRLLASPQPITSVQGDLITADFMYQPPPYDIPLIGNNNYALRYAGQLRIDQEGSYVFLVDPGPEAGDYARLFLDGAPVAHHWPGMAERPAATVELAPGWHDLVLDYADLAAAEQIHLTMQPPSSQPQPIPAAQLRPVRARDLIAAAIGVASTYIADATSGGPVTTTVALPFTAPVGAVVDQLDFFFVLQAQQRGELDVAVVPPSGGGGDPIVLPATPAYENAADYAAARTALAGAPLTATGWNATFTDRVYDAISGYAGSPILVASYHGGPLGPFATAMTFTSSPHPTPGATALGAITVEGQLAGAIVKIEVHTGDDASLANAPWVTVDNGGVPAVPADALVQYRLTITGDGWQYPQVDKVTIEYSRY